MAREHFTNQFMKPMRQRTIAPHIFPTNMPSLNHNSHKQSISAKAVLSPSHLKHLQQSLLADLKPLKGLFFLHHSLTQSLQIPKFSAGHSPGNSKHGQCCSDKYHDVSVVTQKFLTSACFTFLKRKILSNKAKPSTTDLQSRESMIKTGMYRLFFFKNRIHV